MAYIVVNEPRCKTREQMGKNAIIVFAPAILDERTWPAINTATLSGKLINPCVGIFDNGTTIDWAYEDEFPLPLSLGTKVNGEVGMKNNSTIPIIFTTTVWLKDPGGGERGKRVDTSIAIPPGQTTGATTLAIRLDKAGIWTLCAKLEGVAA